MGLYKDNGKENGNHYLGFRAYLWLAGSEEMEKNMETTIIGFVGTTIRLPSSVPSLANQR